MRCARRARLRYACVREGGRGLDVARAGHVSCDGRFATESAFHRPTRAEHDKDYVDDARELREWLLSAAAKPKKHRPERRKDEQLSGFDAEVETRESRRGPISRQADFSERAGKPEAVDEPERERDAIASRSIAGPKVL
jgi:hypothetical protein